MAAIKTKVGHGVPEASVQRRKPGRPRSETVVTRLCDALLALSAEQDPSAITVEGLCRKAGVSRATFYRRWQTTSPILIETLAMLLAQNLPANYGQGSLEEDLSKAAWGLAKLLADERVRRILLYGALRMSLEPDMRKVVHELEQRGFGDMERLLANAKRSGLVRNDVAADMLTYQLFGPIWHRTLILQLPPDAPFVDGLIAAVLRSVAR